MLKMQREKVIVAMKIAQSSGRAQVSNTDKEAWHDALADFGAKMKNSVQFMKRSAFYDFLNSKRKNCLKIKDLVGIEAFYKYHVDELN